MAATTQQLIKRWLPAVREIRQSRGLTASDYSDETMLAIIDVESDGDPYDHRTDSQYYGLLQIGTDNGSDHGLVPVTLLDLPPEQSGRRAIQHFFQYMEPYAKFHKYDPVHVALIWKGGPGVGEDYRELLDSEGVTEQDLENFLANTKTAKYIKRFRNDYRKWSSQKDTVPLISVSQGPGGIPYTVGARSSTGKLVRSYAVTTPAGCGDSLAVSTLGRRTPAGESQGGSVSTGPLVEAREPAVSTAASSRALSTAKAGVLEYIESAYLNDLAVYAEGAYVRYRTDNGYSRADVRYIEAFVDQADTGVYSASFRAIFKSAISNWVRPLVNPVIGNSTWGKKRSYPAKVRKPGEAKTILRDTNTGERLYRRHFGVDYATAKNGLGINQQCYSIADGTVIRANISKTYGRVVYINHGGGVTSRYAHLEKLWVSRGDKVKAGTPIGLTGATEGTKHPDTGRIVAFDNVPPHLHFEIRINVGYLRGGGQAGTLNSRKTNISINPVPILSVCPNPGEVREEIPLELKLATGMVSDAEAAIALATNAAEKLRASNLASRALGIFRGEQLAGATRKDFYDAEQISQQVVESDNAQGL